MGARSGLTNRLLLSRGLFTPTVSPRLWIGAPTPPDFTAQRDSMKRAAPSKRSTCPGGASNDLHRRTARDARRAVEARYRTADPITIRSLLASELIQFWQFTADEAERAARWAMSLELNSSEAAQHELIAVKVQT